MLIFIVKHLPLILIFNPRNVFGSSKICNFTVPSTCLDFSSLQEHPSFFHNFFHISDLMPDLKVERFTGKETIKL